MPTIAGPQTNILSIVNTTVELPTMPEVLTKINEVTAGANASAESVAAVVSKDPAVATNMLRIVNSAYYGLPVRVSSIKLAVSVLGFNMTKKVALKAAVFTTFGKKREPIQHFDPLAFWKHAIYTGVAARALGQQSASFADSNAEDLYIAGLLHDIGKIILLERACPKYLGVLRKAAQTGRPQHEVEMEEFGFTHADVGSVLAIKWSLPEDLAIAIRYHHAPDKDPFHRSLSSLIHIADSLAWQTGHPSTVGVPAPKQAQGVLATAGLEQEHVDALLPRIAEDFAASEMPW